MSAQYFKIAAAVAALMLSIGCANISQGELAALPDAPKTAATGDTILFQFVNLIFKIDSSLVLKEAYVRDSLRVVAGLPDGYEVVDAHYYADMQTPLIRYASPDKFFSLAGVLADANRSRSTPLSTDSTVAERLKGKRLAATPNDSLVLSRPFSPILVQVDSIKQLIGFSVAINCSIPAGTPCDTFLTMSMGYIPPSAYYVRAVYVYLKVTVPADIDGSARKDSLFYYFNTDTSITFHTNPNDTTLYNQMANGSCLQTALDIERSITGSRQRIVSSGPMRVHAPRVFNDPSTGMFTIRSLEDVRDAMVFDLNGKIIQRLANRASVQWNGKEQSGQNARPGTYVIRIETGTKMFHFLAQKVK